MPIQNTGTGKGLDNEVKESLELITLNLIYNLQVIKMKYVAIVSIDIEFTFDANSKEEALSIVENVDLPGNYVEDSFKISKLQTYEEFMNDFC